MIDEKLTADHLRDAADTIDTLTALAAPLLYAAKQGHTRLWDGHGNAYDLTIENKMDPDLVTAITEHLAGTEQQEDLRRWADEMDASGSYDVDPLNDPENVDPEGRHLRALVRRMAAGEADVGAVCGLYELCGHPLCQQSYNTWAELRRAQKALRET